jgi:predicted TIM-barrel fold metal-dependent hydrolase
MVEQKLSRLKFITSTGLLLVGSSLKLQALSIIESKDEKIIDIHQHTHYAGRTNEQLIAHQQAMGVSKTILQPSGRPADLASTHFGKGNGLQADAWGNETCYELAQKYPKRFLFAANEVPDLPGAVSEIEKYLKKGGVGIGESKFGVECDSPEMQKIYALAQEYDVPVLMHWEYKRYNYGFDRFSKMLEKYPKVNFLGHSMVWWASIGKNDVDPTIRYPKTKVVPGGYTDRLLSDYPNMYGDLSAGSGLNALTRDEDHAREFLIRHQDKLLFGSDCIDTFGTGPKCIGANIIAEIRKLCPEKKIRRKLFSANKEKLFRI